MRGLRAWLIRLGGVLGGDRREREFRDELDVHLQMHAEDNQRLGMSAADARRQAVVRLGGIESAREAYRDRATLPLLETAMRDLRFGLRLLRRSPGFSTVVLLTLAMGIGANTVMFSVVNTLLLRQLPYADADRLVAVQTMDALRWSPSPTAPPDFYAFRARNRALTNLEAFYPRPSNLTGGREPERVPTLIVSAGLFDTLGVPPALGRGFVPRDEQWGSHRVAILADGLWQQRFGGDPSIVGRTIAINGESFVVAGVLPRGFSFLGIDAQLFVPLSFEPGDNMNTHNNHFLRMAGRLKPGVSREQAVADLNGILNAIVAEQSVNQGTAMNVVPLRDVLVGRDVRRGLLVLLGAVGFVLLISCANLANLLLSRAAVRQREIAVRLALGATRRRLVWQFLVESLVLSFAGAALGLAVAYVSADLLNVVSQRVLPRADSIRVDRTVLAFTLLVATVTGLLLGLAPAWYSAGAEVGTGLKDGTRSVSDGASRTRLRAVLVIAEVALSLVLLAGAGLMVRSIYQLLHVNAGFTAGQVLTMQVALPALKYVDRAAERAASPLAYARSTAFFGDALDRVRGLPDVQAAGAINGLPLAGEIWGKSVTLYDRPFPPDVRGLPSIQYRIVAGDYFHALRIRILQGRAFSDRDTVRAPKVAIVNQEMVRRHWEGRSPIGKVISVNPPLELLPRSLVEEGRRSGVIPPNYEPDKFTIVGVADDVRYGGLTTPAAPLVYVPFGQGSEGETNMFLVVRTAADPMAAAAAVRGQIALIDPDQPVASVRTMESRVAASMSQQRTQMNVLGAFAAMAILLAAVGIYGVMSYSVAQRSRELGIRLALGAARADVTSLVMRQGLGMVAIGVGLGVGGALLITRLMRTLLFDVSPADPVVFTAIVGLLSSIAAVAIYVPARRASRLDPLTTLRSE